MALSLGRWAQMWEGECTLAPGLGCPEPTPVLLPGPGHKSTDRPQTKERKKGGWANLDPGDVEQQGSVLPMYSM